VQARIDDSQPRRFRVLGDADVQVSHQRPSTFAFRDGNFRSPPRSPENRVCRSDISQCILLDSLLDFSPFMPCMAEPRSVAPVSKTGTFDLDARHNRSPTVSNQIHIDRVSRLNLAIAAITGYSWLWVAVLVTTVILAVLLFASSPLIL
jgi:hypothetical protein